METLPISVYTGSEDHKLFTDVVNMGIDSRLTGFTKSKFHYGDLGTRLYLDFDMSEIEILLRRLSDIEDEDAESWLSDIIYSIYNVETY